MQFNGLKYKVWVGLSIKYIKKTTPDIWPICPSKFEFWLFLDLSLEVPLLALGDLETFVSKWVVEESSVFRYSQFSAEN